MANESLTTTSNFGDARVEMLHKRLLEIGEQEMLLSRFGREADQVTGHGVSQSWFRYNRLDVPLGTLTEGIPPDNDQLGLTKVTATISQRGQVLALSDRLILETDHNVIPVGMDLLGDSRAKLFERVCYDTLLGGTNVVYAGAGASRSDVTAGASDVLDTGEVKEGLRVLRAGDNVNGAAKPFSSGMTKGHYVCIVHSNPMLDLREDSTYLTAAQQQDIEELRDSQFAAFKWQGVLFLETNWMPEIQEVGDWTAGNDTLDDGTLTTDTSGSSYAAGETASIVVTAKHKKRGFEELLYTTVATATEAGTTFDVSVLLPSDSNYVFNIYEEEGASVTYANHKLAYSNQEAATTVTVQNGDGTGDAPPAAPASGETIYPCFMFGQDFYARPRMSGSKEGVKGSLMPSFVGGAKQPTFSDPLAQLIKMGYKEFFDCLILNDNFGVRIEVASNYT